MRLLLVVMLVVIGGFLTLPASVGIWTKREIGNEDRFVGHVEDVFAEEDVQTLLAQRMTDKIVELTDLQTRIGDSLAQINLRSEQGTSADLTVLEGPLTRAAWDAIYQMSLNVIRSDAFAQVADTALRATHRSVKAVLDHDSAFVSRQGDAIVLDLTPALEQIVKDLGGDKGQQLVSQIDIPPDAGKFVLTEKSDQPAAWKVVSNLKYANPWVPLAAIVCFALAIAIARDRFGTLLWIGVTIALIAAISFTLLALPLKGVATSWPATSQGQAVARSTYEVLLRSYQIQNVFLIAFGGLLVGVASLGGGRRSASPAAWAREHTSVLRIAGLAGASLALLAGPNFSSRFRIEILMLLAVFLLAVEVVTSDAAWARSTRSRLGDALAPHAPPGAEHREAGKRESFSGWVAAQRTLLRVFGIIVGVAIVLVWPSLTQRLIITVIALELLYLAAIEVVAGHAHGND